MRLAGACDAPGAPASPFDSNYRTRCDNDVAFNGCASAGGATFRCTNPMGRSGGTTGGRAEMWTRCATDCKACLTGTCDNDVPIGECAFDGGYTYKCVKPSASNHRGSGGGENDMWLKCSSNTCC